jgi:hypothetical protein
LIILEAALQIQASLILQVIISTLHSSLCCPKFGQTSQPAVKMEPRGVINEGMNFDIDHQVTNVVDGIHVDMNHLKKGEVK